VPFAERKGSTEGKVSFAESILLPAKEAISVVIVKFKSLLKKFINKSSYKKIYFALSFD
jgi:hypothetical protein